LSREDDIETLHEIVEKNGISETVRMLAEVCSDKADEAGDDSELVEVWADAAEELDNLDLNDS
jgi:hypothetical protein